MQTLPDSSQIPMTQTISLLSSAPVEPPAPQVYRSEPVAEVASPETPPVETVEPHPLTKKQRRRQRKLAQLKVEAERLYQEHGLGFRVASKMLERGWSLKKALQWQHWRRYIRTYRGAGLAKYTALVQRWIEQREPLVRWGLSERWSARLEAEEQYEWKWSDLATLQPKLEVLAIFPRASYSAWTGTFQIDAEIRAERRTLTERRRERFEVLPLFWIEAYQNRQRCRLTFLNGTQLSGYPLWFEKYSVVLSPTSEGEEPGVLVFFHGLASVENLDRQTSPAVLGQHPPE